MLHIYKVSEISEGATTVIGTYTDIEEALTVYCKRVLTSSSRNFIELKKDNDMNNSAYRCTFGRVSA